MGTIYMGEQSQVNLRNNIQSDQQETKSRVLPHLLFYRNVRRILIRHFYILAVHTRFVGCLPLKNLLLIAFINFL
jgi:hypothetical protein